MLCFFFIFYLFLILYVRKKYSLMIFELLVPVCAGKFISVSYVNIIIYNMSFTYKLRWVPNIYQNLLDHTGNEYPVNTLTTFQESSFQFLSLISYETCWPVIQQGAQGIIFVYSPGREEHARVLDNLYTHFAEQQAVSEAQCVVFCHYKPGAKGKGAKLCEWSAFCFC